MAYLVDIEQLISDVQTYLDTDPRFIFEDSGAFTYGSERIYYERGPDEYILHVEGAKVHCPRP